MKRCMVDIETLGLDPGDIVLSIGAVMFNRDGIIHEFYENIDIQSSQNAGLEINARTLEWWLQQDEEAQDCLTGGVPLREALELFKGWYEMHEPDEVWANSPAMDCTLLEAAFEAVDMTEPWEYDEERDQRTIESLVDTEPEVEVGTKHNALDDAKRQAKIVSQLLSEVQA